MPVEFSDLLIGFSILAFVFGLFISQKFRSFVVSILMLPVAFTLSVWSLQAAIFWWPAKKLMKLFPRSKQASGLFGFLIEFFGHFVRHPLDKLLVAGKRKDVALEVWPKDKYPQLYCKVPSDINRPLWEDGRLPNGVSITWLADRHVTKEMIGRAAQMGVLLFMVLAVATFVGLTFQVLDALATPFGDLFNADLPVLEKWPGEDPILQSRWALLGGFLIGFAKVFGITVLNSAKYLAASAVTAIGASLLVSMMVLETMRRKKAAPYANISKDADVRWPYRAETRALVNAGYARQIDLANGYLKDAKLFSLGKATGTLRVRGDLCAPSKEQDIMLDQDSLFQHVMVMGGTGEGKTTAILKPLMRQFMKDRKTGMFVIDAKGVLWEDARDIAKNANRLGDVVVIGTGKDQLGFDVTALLTPTQIAAVMRSVMRQMGGGESDSFWPDMAANLLRQVLEVGQAYSKTKEFNSWYTPDHVAPHPYSLYWAYEAVINETLLSDTIASLMKELVRLEEEVEAGIKAKKDVSDLEEKLEALSEPSLVSAMSYLQGSWANMASETKTGITANVVQLLGGFSGTKNLRNRFASGKDYGIADLREALDGKIVLIALSSIEDGLPARLVSILIKTSLYREARLREAQMKREGKEKPQDKPCIVMMDEVQEVVTVDPTSGLSDATFWNVARSTGLAGVFATQTVAALEQAMGKPASSNFLQQARTKIFLRTEDQATVEYACWCAGKFERNRVYEEGQNESLEQRKLIEGWSVFDPIVEDHEAEPKNLWRLLLSSALSLVMPSRRQSARTTRNPTYALDKRFIPKGGFGASEGVNLAKLSAEQSSAWRAEDLERDYRTKGNEIMPALTPADIIAMGRWHAYAHVQRAGAVRQDIMTLQHDFE